MGLGLYFLYKTFFQKNEHTTFQNQQNYNRQNSGNEHKSAMDGEYVDYEDLSSK